MMILQLQLLQVEPIGRDVLSLCSPSVQDTCSSDGSVCQALETSAFSEHEVPRTTWHSAMYNPVDWPSIVARVTDRTEQIAEYNALQD